MAVDGRWNVTLDTPMGAQQVELELVTEGSVLTGSLTSPIGKGEITGGSVDGDEASWTAAITSPVKATLKFAATFTGDTVAGKLKIGPMPGGKFTGERVPASA